MLYLIPIVFLKSKISKMVITLDSNTNTNSNDDDEKDPILSKLYKLLDQDHQEGNSNKAPFIQGLVFDCDGTLLDTMPIYYESWQRSCRDVGLLHRFPMERFYEMAGRTVEDIFQILIDEEYGDQNKKCDFTAKDCEKLKRKYHHEIETNEGRVAWSIDVVVSIVKRYHGKISLAVASSGWRDHVINGLERIGILNLFDAVVTADEVEVKHPKPAPDIYIEAARRLNVCPTRCIGFEDADLGMLSIRNANFYSAIDVRELYMYPRRINRP